MFRNHEVKQGFVLLLTAGILFAVLTAWFPGLALFWIIGLFAAAAGSYLAVNHLRYRKISELSMYLKRVLGGEMNLHVPDNAEGELSLLRNDIYKLVTTLETQAELLRADRAYLADSLSNISHQLKTPMTSMLVITDILREDLPEEKREDFMKTLRSQLKRMEWLLSALLKISRLDAGTVQFKQETVEVKTLVDHAAEHLLIPMELKEQTFSAEIPEGLTLTCDLSWTAEAVANILKNCMEHTPEQGRITVRGEEHGLYVQLVIEDTGEGILPEELPHIFERFYKGRNAGKDSVGIGLAMAKDIIGGQNGKMEVESTPGAGTRFIIRMYRKVI